MNSGTAGSTGSPDNVKPGEDQTLEQNDETNLVTRAQELIAAADNRDVPLRLVGSVAFRLLTDNQQRHAETFDRELGDIDLVGRKEDTEVVREVIEDHSYQIDKDLLLAGWGDRYVFYADDHEIDVFFGDLSMCHELPLSGRLTIGENPYTVTPADLLLEKAQIVEITEKDLKDLTLILLECPLTDDETGVNREHIANLLAIDWGFYHTVSTNLDKLEAYLDSAPIDNSERETVRDRIADLRRTIEEEPKTLRWQLRSMIGERLAWYNEVEEKHR